ncbi:Adaptor for signal transduction [Ascosphaera atra]|nr:Adaptor for signal transduction [Ascosphaera atra]
MSDDGSLELLSAVAYKPPGEESKDIEYAASDVTASTPIEDEQEEELLPAASFTPFSLTAENTPTYAPTYGKRSEAGSSPRSPRTPTSLITGWSADDCAVFIASLGLAQYCEAFLDNEIVGEALIALHHDELREIGIASAGHRLTILKRIYEVKKKQGVPVLKSHYVPISAEEDHTPVTKGEIADLAQSVRDRDDRILAAEIELRKLADDYRRMREELLPVVKLAKDRSQPLPYQPAGAHYGSTLTPDYQGANNGNGSAAGNNGSGSGGNDTVVNPAPDKSLGSSLTRTLSKKLFSSSSKNSPTHLPPAQTHERTHDHPTLDPSSAAFASPSNAHLAGSGLGSYSSPKTNGNQPSPTSPSFYNTPKPRTPYTELSEEAARTGMSSPSHNHSHHTTPPMTTTSSMPSSATPNTAAFSSSTGPSGLHHTPSTRHGHSHGHHHDIHGSDMKSFRVTMEDPCYKVLPAALRKYGIKDDWRAYALYIVCGEKERCLGLEEKPLILFKQLDKEGRKPMFMLRKHMGASGGGGVGPSSSGGGGGSDAVRFGGGGMGNGGGSIRFTPNAAGGGRGTMMYGAAASHQHSIGLPGGVL